MKEFNLEKKRFYRINSMFVIKNIYERFSDLASRKLIPPYLVLTGSWGIEVVSRKKLDEHGDIDMQLYHHHNESPDEWFNLIFNLRNYNLKQLNNQCFLYASAMPIYPPVEISIYSYSAKTDAGNAGNLILTTTDKNTIPLTQSYLTGNNKENILVWVKPLEFQIATWTIRIFGKPLNTRREVLQRDLTHLGILTSGVYDKNKVLMYIKNHPQFNYEEDDAEKILNNLEKLQQK